MNLLQISKKYNTKLKCLKLMEKLRWGENVKCPYCESDRNRPAQGEAGRYACKNCKRTFSVMIDTIFEDTRLPLPKWFMIIGLMLNSKSGMSAKEIQRQLGVTYKTAYYTAMRIRIGMLEPDSKLHGLLEMDESYFSSSKKYRAKNSPKNVPDLANIKLKRGRGTNNVSVAGIVERGGTVRTKVVEKLTKRNLLYFLKQSVESDESILITDGFSSYKNLAEHIEHLTINHSKEFSKGITHVNTIEGFWSYVKNGIRGNYKAISPKYLPLYLIEYEWKYNYRNFHGNQFEIFLKNALLTDKELEYWKAQSAEEVKDIAYG